MTQVELDYEAGLWVPSYYGNKFTVAQRQFVGSEGEQSLDFKVATLAEAQAEADKRNQAINTALVKGLKQLSDCNLTEDNCASFEVANRRIHNIARAALAKGGTQ